MFYFLSRIIFICANMSGVVQNVINDETTKRSISFHWKEIAAP